MERLFVPTRGPDDWRRLLADPDRRWREGKSAYELATAWEAASRTERGLPPDVADVLDRTPELAGAQILMGIPEHKVPLDGGGHASQTDLWAVLEARPGLVSVAIEAKAGEPFGPPVSDWLADASPTSGKPARLRQLCEVLGITDAEAQTCRYQLLHRAAAAIIEARRFGLGHALLLVQSFSHDPGSLSDFAHFAERLGATGQENTIAYAGVRNGLQFWLGWITSVPAAGR